MGKSTNPRPRATGNRSSGGRPRKSGERYPSGKLKPIGPNAEMLARRKAICADVTMASCPLDAAFSNGWLTAAEYGAGRAYIAIHARAQLGSPTAPTQADQSRPDPVGDVRRVTWSEMSHDEIARIWDSAMRDVGSENAAARMEESQAKAMIQWKALNAAMAPFERMEVDLVCIQESWPQWIIQRSAGHMDTSWERKRSTLINGLAVIRASLVKPKPADGPVPIVAGRPSSASRVAERQIYVDAAGQQVLEVERIVRRSGH